MNPKLSIPALKTGLPVLLLMAALLGAYWLADGSAAKHIAAPNQPPVVKIVSVRAQRLRLPVHSQGVVMPVREIELAAEVQGKVIVLHPEFVAGGRFKAGEVLVSIAPAVYDLAVVQSETRLVEAKRALAEEQAAGQQAQREWRVLGEGTATPLSLREPQLQEAKAKLKQAEAELADARLRRSFCDIRAPFSGKVREKMAAIGQFVEIGKPLGHIYADDAAEIRLPLTQAQIAYLQAPDHSGKRAGPKVMLSGDVQPQPITKQGLIVRREGIVEPSTGLEYWVARLEHPEREPALLPGAFVSAEIEGRELDNVYVLPPVAVNPAQEAVLVDADNRLRIVRLNVLHRDAERVLVSGGLSVGDRLVVSGVAMPMPGMAVVVETSVQSVANPVIQSRGQDGG